MALICLPVRSEKKRGAAMRELSCDIVVIGAGPAGLAAAAAAKSREIYVSL